MLHGLFLYIVCVLCLQNACSFSLSSSSDAGVKKEELVLESVKEFLRLVDKYNLDLSIIGSHNNYRYNGKVKESSSAIAQMAVVDEFLTEADLDAANQEKYLTKLEKLVSNENIGAKTRVIHFKDGEESSVDEQSVNSKFLIDSSSYDSFAKYKNGKPATELAENKTSTVLYNYFIKNVSANRVKKVEVVTMNVIISVSEVSKKFPAEVLDEIKQVLPGLWLSTILDVLPRMLSEHLNARFDGTFNVLVDTTNFDINGKPYATFDVPDAYITIIASHLPKCKCRRLH